VFQNLILENCSKEKGFIKSDHKKERRIQVMFAKTEWIKILTECRNNVQKKIEPLLRTINKPQPDLGLGAGGDPTRKIDVTAENAIVDVLKKSKITFTLISEESGIVEYGESPRSCYVTVDPIDGTTNLIRGIPFYATSIAVSKKPSLKTVHAGLVADLVHGTTYTALRGRGAYRDNGRITPSQETSIEEGVIGVDLNSYRIRQLAPRLTALMSQAEHIRHFGANALELCYVAEGIIDAFVDIRGKLRTTDVAAASLILAEAGGILTTPEGQPLDVKLDPKQKVEFIAAANAKIYDRIFSLVKAQKEQR
jgi:myo-inositol-1(or 4)-monophosphatase